MTTDGLQSVIAHTCRRSIRSVDFIMLVQKDSVKLHMWCLGCSFISLFIQHSG